MKYEIRRGESLVYSIGPTPAQDLTVGTWLCKFGVFTKEGKMLLQKTTTDLDDNNLNFVPYFTPDETRLIGEGSFLLVTQIERTDSTPPLAKEVIVNLTVTKEYIQ